jgi:very-short-patch-repair endonuclease
MYKSNPRLDYPLYYGTRPEILKLARDNRNHPTEAEAKLWALLRQRHLFGVKFRRQHPISRFIADFYCHQAKLIIEVDGGYHEDEQQRELDQGRQAELEDLGLVVLRFKNEDVEEGEKQVIEKIRSVLRSRMEHGR